MLLLLIKVSLFPKLQFEAMIPYAYSFRSIASKIKRFYNTMDHYHYFHSTSDHRAVQ